MRITAEIMNEKAIIELLRGSKKIIHINVFYKPKNTVRYYEYIKLIKEKILKTKLKN